MTTQLKQMPTTSVVRTGSGAVAADNTVVNTTNYPYTLGFNPDCRVGKIVVSWTATGTAVNDWLDLQVLIWDGLQGAGTWVEGDIVRGVRPGELATLDVGGASFVCIRVVRAVSPGGTNLIIRAAQGAYLG